LFFLFKEAELRNEIASQNAKIVSLQKQLNRLNGADRIIEDQKHMVETLKKELKNKDRELNLINHKIRRQKQQQPTYNQQQQPPPSMFELSPSTTPSHRNTGIENSKLKLQNQDLKIKVKKLRESNVVLQNQVTRWKFSRVLLGTGKKNHFVCIFVRSSV
jgi:hypothetical protein